jgi:hypothetical protein
MKTPPKKPTATVEVPDTKPVEKPTTPPVEMPPMPTEIITEPVAVAPPKVPVEFPTQPHDHGMSHPDMMRKKRFTRAG